MQRRQNDGLAPQPVPMAGAAGPSPYDTLALKERANQWRVEAERATIGAMRSFCLEEAEKCELRLQISRFTPIIRDWDSPKP